MTLSDVFVTLIHLEETLQVQVYVSLNMFNMFKQQFNRLKIKVVASFPCCALELSSDCAATISIQTIINKEELC